MNRNLFIALFTLVCVVAAVFWPPLPQPLDYHAFVDRRAFDLRAGEPCQRPFA